MTGQAEDMKYINVNVFRKTLEGWFKHILLITSHEKRIGQSEKLCLALSISGIGRLVTVYLN